MRLIAIAGGLAASLLAVPAAAELSYSYAEFSGSPFLQTPRIPVTVPDVLGEKHKVKLELEGWGVGVGVGYEINDHWHAFARYQYSTSDSNDLTFTGILDEQYAGSFNVEQHAFTIGPGLHLGLSDKTDVVVELGFLYTRPKVDLRGTVTSDLLPPPGSYDLDTIASQNQYGIMGRMGLRHMVLPKLELFGYMTAASVNLTTNNIFWEFGSRYDIREWLAASASFGVGTDAQIGVNLGLRVYYDHFYKTE